MLEQRKEDQPTQQFYDIAENMLTKKDFAGFMENIGVAMYLAKNERDFLSKVTFLKVKGLYEFQQHTRLVEFSQFSLDNITNPDEIFLTKKYCGISLGYLGQFEESLNVFKSLLNEPLKDYQIWETYLNIAWVNLAFYKIDEKGSSLSETKDYLDKASSFYERFDNRLKRIMCNNLSVYHYYAGDLEKGIDILQEAVHYCDEVDLPKVYNNLAEYYLKLDEKNEGISPKIKEYTKMAEVIGTKYNNNLEIAKAFYTTAMVELKEDDLFKSLDALYLSFEYFKEAEAYTYAFDCLLKINQIVREYKDERLISLKHSLKNKLKDTPFYSKI